MPPDVRHLRAFAAVAEDLSFRAAAERLGIAQPALSRTIKQLESMLELPLLERTTRKVDLTEPGRLFLAKTEKLLRDLDEAVEQARRLHSGATGLLRVGFNDFAISGLLPEIVRRFRGLYPEVEVDLIDASSPAMIDMLLDSDLEVAFNAASGSHGDLESMIVRKERLLCVVPVSHRLADQEVISVTDLAQEPFIMGPQENWNIFTRKIRDFCRHHGFEPRVIQEAEHSDGIVGFVAADMGVTLYVDTEFLRHMKGVRARPLRQRPPRIETRATWRRDRRASMPAIDRFLKVTSEVVKASGETFG